MADSASKQIIIVGAGPGGLAAALLLAKAGHRVTVLEKQGHVGGRTSAMIRDGFRFDLGPTFFLYPQVLERIYRILGRDLFSDVPMTRLDPQYRVQFGTSGQYLDCTPNLERMAGEVAKLNVEDSRNIERFILNNRVKIEKFRPSLERPFLGLRNLLSLEMLKMLPMLRPWASVDDELRRYFSDPRVRLAFSFQSKYLGMSPFNCPSLFSILSYLEYDFGVWHPQGGCSAVSEHMATLATDMGVTLKLNEPVKELLWDGNRCVGARTEHDSYACDSMVINADFAHAMKSLVPNKLRKRWSDDKIEKKKYSCSTFMMYLGIEGEYRNVNHHTIYTSNDYEGNLSDIETKHRLTEDPSIYVQNACVTDATLAPSGMSTLYVLAPVSHRTSNIDWTVERPRFREIVLKQLEKVGIANVEKRIRFEKVITPQSWEDDYDVFKGATFNLAHTWKQMLHLRPQNRMEGLRGVYLVGGGTHPGSGLPVIYESARITTRLIQQEFGLDHAFLELEPSPARTISQDPVMV